MRSLGSSEACWRLFGFNISERHPAVYAMRVHLQGEEMIYYEEGQQRQAAQQDHTTELTGFLSYNKAHPDTAVKYCDFPEIFTWHKPTKKWVPRRGSFNTIGRVLTIHPLAGEVYYLRMLLNHDQSKGAGCHEVLKRVHGHCHDTFKGACEALGLLQSDNEWHTILTDAALTQMCPQIKELFVTLLLFNKPSDPAALFDQHYMEWWDDLKQNMPTPPDDKLLRAMVLLDIERRLQNHSKELPDFYLPTIPHDMRQRVREQDDDYKHAHLPMVIQEELAYDITSLQSIVADRLNGNHALLPSQRAVYDAVMDAVQRKIPLAIFLDARGGTGKTYTLNALLAATRTLDNHKNISLAVASSGIVATLLLGSRTFHSRFKVPIQITESTTFQITKQSAVADLIDRAKLIVWDEAPMGHRHLLEALDRTLRDITSQDLPFGGKVMVLAGDFRQVLPVIKRGSRAQIVDASLKRSKLWSHFTLFNLTENMRVLQSGDDKELKEFDAWLLQLGNGHIDYIRDDTMVLPPHMCMTIDDTSRNSLNRSIMMAVSWVFPDLHDRKNDYEWIAQRAILAPKNSAVDTINEHISSTFPETLTMCRSADSTIDEDDATRFPTEYLNTINTAGMPPHCLALKKGMPLLLPMNLNPKEGLCNGTRLIVKEIVHGCLLKACQLQMVTREDGKCSFHGSHCSQLTMHSLSFGNVVSFQ
ncbi:PREDICTED: uncharacterized protein LOC106818314 [Priapulus caudatus]|uniref:ATP-dependent DNA helicase n=1 Tax=Priapulus caudatus TaxID=37621 RepID=A0ABM1F247_PRICU|nr:PREDICTED: uncharacterized protein LOC106818314 [Priapulus caudatus]